MRMRPELTSIPPRVDDDQRACEELVGNLLRSGEGAVFELLDRFSPLDRANLALFCYRKAHLHGIGLAVAATCDEEILIAALGTVLGTVIFHQSRERAPAPRSVSIPQHRKITLARSQPVDANALALLQDEVDEPEASDEPVAEFAA
jgi:hypothetical protein